MDIVAGYHDYLDTPGQPIGPGGTSGLHTHVFDNQTFPTDRELGWSIRLDVGKIKEIYKRVIIAAFNYEIR